MPEPAFRDGVSHEPRVSDCQTRAGGPWRFVDHDPLACEALAFETRRRVHYSLDEVCVSGMHARYHRSHHDVRHSVSLAIFNVGLIRPVRFHIIATFALPDDRYFLDL